MKMPALERVAKERRLRLKYSGGLASFGELDAYDLSEAISGFSDFLTALGTARFGNDFEVHPNISAIERGSFDVEFVLHLLSSDTAGLLYAALQVPSGFAGFLKLISEVFSLLKHLQGEPPKLVERQREGTVMVTNNNGVINNFSAETLVVISEPSAGRAARKFVGRPLQTSATDVEVLSNGELVASASREQSGSFTPINIGEVLAENSNEMHLTIQTAVFEGKTNWKFNDGQKTFSAPIEDSEFLANVSRGREAFRKGDELVVRMRATQKRLNGQLRAEYAIEKVIQHVSKQSNTARLL
jgi:hypothetical protein